MRHFYNPIDLIKNLISPPKAKTIDRSQVSTAAEDAAAEKAAAAEARRKAEAEAQKKKGAAQARSLISGTGQVGIGDTTKPSLLGG